jgi:precorrin-6A/cobalt-precorrin-6A reductase
MQRRRVLIFGGTGEARELADLLVADGFEVTTALAGVTSQPHLPRGTIHSGRFGGADGIARFAKAEEFDLLIDATHPFAARISANIASASGDLGVQCWRLERAAWQAEEGDQWTEVADFAEAATAVPANGRVFLTIGHRGLEPFFDRLDLSGVIRVIEEPKFALPPGWQLIRSRPPHPLVDELDLMNQSHVSVLVSKNAGGTATYTKLVAARQRGIKVVMIRRPIKAPMTTFHSATELLAKSKQ